MGVEEEFLLVDPDTGRTTPAARRVLRAATALPNAAGDSVLHRELLASQVEAATGRCLSLSELGAQLLHGRRQLARAAGKLLVVPSGTAVLGGDPAITPGERFGRIADRYADVVADYQACGCHVHVGVPDLETAVGVVNHLRPWLPTLLALSVNSPVHHGGDTGYASWRIGRAVAVPRGRRAAPVRLRRAIRRAGRHGSCRRACCVDAAQTFWLVRPSAHAADRRVPGGGHGVDVDGAVLQAALSPGARAHRARRPGPRPARAADVDDQVAAAAVWSAARYGLAGPAVHPLLACRAPAAELLEELLVRRRARAGGDGRPRHCGAPARTARHRRTTASAGRRADRDRQDARGRRVAKGRRPM